MFVMRAQDPPPTFMSSTSGGVDSKFQAWLHTDGLHAPKDFKLAFTSAQRAFDACPVAPETAASAWISISHSEVEVASSWALWIKSRHNAGGQMPTRPHDTKPAFRIWRVSKIRRHAQIKVLLMIARGDEPPSKTPSVLRYRGKSEVA